MGYFKWIATLLLVTLASTSSAFTTYYFRLNITDVISNNDAVNAVDEVMMTISSALNDTMQSQYYGTHSILVSNTSTSIPNSISIIYVSLSDDYRIDMMSKLVYRTFINATRTIQIGGSNPTILNVKVFSNLEDSQLDKNAITLYVCQYFNPICPNNQRCIDTKFQPLCIDQCDYGQYFNSDHCENCPANKTTLTKGAFTSDRCIDVCQHGYYFSLANSSCITCPSDLFWNEADQSCYVCPFENFNSTTCINGTARQVNNRRINIDFDTSLVTSSCTLGNFSTLMSQKDSASSLVRSYAWSKFMKLYYRDLCFPTAYTCDNIEATVVNNEICVPDPAHCSNQTCDRFKTTLHITIFQTWDYVEPVINMSISQYYKSSVDALLGLMFDLSDLMSSSVDSLELNPRFELPFNPKITVVDIKSKQLFVSLKLKPPLLSQGQLINSTVKKLISDNLHSTVPEFLMLEILDYGNCTVLDIPTLCVNLTIWLKQNATDALLYQMADILIQSHEKVIGNTGDLIFLGLISLYRSHEDLQAGVNNVVNWCDVLNRLSLASFFCEFGGNCVSVDESGYFICENISSSSSLSYPSMSPSTDVYDYSMSPSADISDYSLPSSTDIFDYSLTPSADNSDYSISPSADISDYSMSPSEDIFDYSPTPSADISGYSMSPSADISDYSLPSSADISDYSISPSADISDYSMSPSADISDYSLTPSADNSDYSMSPSADISDYSLPSSADISDYSISPAADISDYSMSPSADISDYSLTPSADNSDYSMSPSTDISDYSLTPSADNSDYSMLPSADISDYSLTPSADNSDYSMSPSADIYDYSLTPSADNSDYSMSPSADISDYSLPSSADISDYSISPAADISDYSMSPSADISDYSLTPSADDSDYSMSPSADISDYSLTPSADDSDYSMSPSTDISDYSLTPSADNSDYSMSPSADISDYSLTPSADNSDYSMSPSTDISEYSLTPSADNSDYSMSPSADISDYSLTPSADISDYSLTQSASISEYSLPSYTDSSDSNLAPSSYVSESFLSPSLSMSQSSDIYSTPTSLYSELPDQMSSMSLPSLVSEMEDSSQIPTYSSMSQSPSEYLLPSSSILPLESDLSSLLLSQDLSPTPLIAMDSSQEFSGSIEDSLVMSTSAALSSSSSLYASSTDTDSTTISSMSSSTTPSSTASIQTTTTKPTTSSSIASSKKQRALYPYGISANDAQVPTSGGSYFYYWYDAISKPIYFTTGVPFGSDLLKVAHVLPNGVITFGKRNRVWNSDLSYLYTEADVYVIAPFWSYANPHSNGSVFYQLYEKSSNGAAAVLTRASTEVMEQFGLNSYNAITALVVTWKNVEPASWYTWLCDYYEYYKQYYWWELYYQSLYEKYCLNQKRESNTFQAVYVTDGLTAYVIVTYLDGSMSWNFEDSRYISVGFVHPDDYRDYGVTYTDLTTKMDSIVWNTGRYGTWIEKVGETKNPDSQCYDFFLRNKYLMINTRHQEQVKALFDCPCTLGSLGAQWWYYSWTGVEEDEPRYSYIICYAISPIAKTRLARFQGNPLNKLCCYKYTYPDFSSYWTWDAWYQSWMNAPYISYRDPNAGYLLLNDPWWWWGNVRKSKEEDINPHRWCCEESSSPSYFCSLFNQVRPDYGCSLNAEFITGRALGDPHIRTLDGLEYAFNGLGEYCMILMEDFALQARTAQALNSQGNKTNATIFVAFAAKEGNDARFQVEIDAIETDMIITVNNHDCTTDFYNLKNYNETFDNNSISVKRMENENKTAVVVSFPSGISVEVYVGVKNLEFSVNMPMEFKGKLKGLMGNFNGKPDDDFELQDGTRLSPNSTEREIFEKFGKDWEVTTSTSIFTYPPNETALNYQHPEFRPLFKEDINDTLLANAKLKCGDNDACIFDYVLTGNEEFATNTKNVMRQASIVQDAQRNQLPLLKIDKSMLNSKHQWEVTHGEPAQINFTATDADTEDIVTFMLIGSTTSSLSIDSKSGLLSYTPNMKSSVTIGVQAKDSKGGQSNIVYVDVVVCPDCSGHGDCDKSRTQENEMENGRFVLSVCSCWPAYTGANCELNYNACKDQPCLTGQECFDKIPEQQGNSTTGYNCGSCPVGYEERDNFCVDINECIANGTAPVCPQNAECENAVGSYSCSCLPGYRLDPKNDSNCKDVDECAEKTHTCQQLCDNTDGGFNCSCLPGNTLKSDKRTCQQDATSATLCANKGCNQACTVTAGVANCACYTGYINSTETVCTDIDECALRNKPCSQSCQNTVGGFLCSCYPGYTLDIDNVSCKKCETPYYGYNCSSMCVCNGHGTCDSIRGCECNAGWTGVNCNQDVNECNTNGACPIGQICLNTLGSFYCQCPSGYTNVSGVCQDINECLNVLDNTCDLSLEDCVNNVGSYICQCRNGFARDKNNVCKDIDECATSGHNCEQICENTLGKFNCKCNYGFTLNSDRVSCVKNKDVCAGKNLNCSEICTVDLITQQPYCLCKSGFSFQGTEECVDINECDFTHLNLCGQKDKCNNTNGTYTCSCSPGYRLDNDGRTCLACSQGKWGVECANDCACSTGTDRCDPQKGCICKAGFTGTKCEKDLDECSTGVKVCLADGEECINTFGSSSCQCIKGYNKVNGQCQDIDECASYLTNDCDQVCQNNVGGYTCSCHAGYEYNSQYKNCSDIDECTLKLANCEQVCENTNGGYHCSCLSGLKLNVDGVTCAVSTECATKACSDKCAVVNGNETCHCPKGKTLNETNDSQCIDVNMCISNPCSGGCKETADGSSFICTCPTGKKLASDGFTCTDCTEGTYGDNCSQTCSCTAANTVSCDKVTGTCNCKSGWRGSTCGTDINECNAPPSCKANSHCMNTLGSYICKCDAGFYTSDSTCSACTLGTYGEECSNQCQCDLSHSTCKATDGSCLCSSGWTGLLCDADINECDNASNTCVVAKKANWVCKNTPGSYTCGCDKGYSYDDKNDTCVDLNECATSYTNECDGNCTNKNGSYSCSCNSGYTLASDEHKCDDIDECTQGSSGCQQNCVNEVGKFSCTCNIGYTVDDTDLKKCYASSGFGYQVTIDMDVSTKNLREKQGTDYLLLKDILEKSIFNTIIIKVAGLRKVAINNMKHGSVIVDFTSVVDKTVTGYAASKMVEAILSIAESGILVGNETKKATVTIGNVTVPPVKDKCIILNALEACDSDSSCALNDEGEAYCNDNKEDLNVPLIVGLSVGLPLAVLCITTIIGCIWYKKKYTAQRRINVREANYSERPSTPKESLSGSRPSSAIITPWTDKDQLVSES